MSSFVKRALIEADVQGLAEQLAPLLKQGDIIRLEGPLGAGKTTFARALIEAFAGDGDAPSPTYTLVETYEGSAFSLWHFDLYRLETTEDVYELGIEECFEEGAALIEWPDRADGVLPHKGLRLVFEVHGEKRDIDFQPDQDWAARLLKAGIA